MPRFGRRLEWTASGRHQFEFELRQPRWPPFYATALFPPRVNLRIKNMGETLPRTTAGLYVAAYDGPIGEISSRAMGWVDSAHVENEGDWKPGETHRIRLRVSGRNLPNEGTYVLKLFITKWVPLGTPYEEAMAATEGDDVPEETKRALLRSSQESWQRMGIDPHREQPGGFKGEGIHEIVIIDYFRVEPLSSVLTFWLVVATLLIALATFVLAVAPE
jgi:hypothetical protein